MIADNKGGEKEVVGQRKMGEFAFISKRAVLCVGQQQVLQVSAWVANHINIRVPG